MSGAVNGPWPCRELEEKQPPSLGSVVCRVTVCVYCVRGFKQKRTFGALGVEASKKLDGLFNRQLARSKARKRRQRFSHLCRGFTSSCSV